MAKAYEALGDTNKALEYKKQAYGIYSDLFKEGHKDAKEIKSEIELLQPSFFVTTRSEQILSQVNCFGGNNIGGECRWFITTRGETNSELITIKQKIQKEVLNGIAQSLKKYGWSYVGWHGSDLGVKGYLEKSYLNKELGTLEKNENIEIAQMLCFEAMNLGIMKFEEKPYSIVQEFTRSNPELVKKIAIEHPEFFVDGSIIEACVKAMPDDPSCEAHLFKHVQYLGMNRDKKDAF